MGKHPAPPSVGADPPAPPAPPAPLVVVVVVIAVDPPAPVVALVVGIDEAPPELKSGLSLPFAQAAMRLPVAMTRASTLRLAYFTGL
jgi:hypothetical protein